MSFSKVRMFVICICSSAEIFAAWSSASEIGFNLGIQIDVKGLKRFVIRKVPFMWERKVFMYCKYSSIFFFFTIARSISDSFLCLKCWYEKEIWRERVFIVLVLATVSLSGLFFFFNTKRGRYTQYMYISRSTFKSSRLKYKLSTLNSST
jgi:hypothetical protein